MGDGNNNRRRVFIIGDEFGYPFGRATVNRVRDIASGLVDHGAQVALILTEPSEPLVLVRNKARKGHANQIPFLYACGQTVIPQNLLYKRILRYRGLIHCIRIMSKRRNRARITALLYVRHMTTIIVLGLACRFLRISCVLELCEWPSALPNHSFLDPLRKRLFERFAARFVDGAVVISRFLEDRLVRVRRRGSTPLPTLLVPILVNPALYAAVETVDTGDAVGIPRLVYCGFLDHTEPVVFLLEVAAELQRRGGRFTLHILGTAGDIRVVERIKKHAAHCGVSSRTFFPGYLDYVDLLRYYRTATALLLPLESGVRSLARFPTKLGEYLLSGRPVIISRVGESMNYLEHLKSCAFVAPDDHAGFADAIEMLCSSPRLQGSIGKGGAEVARVAFRPETHGRRILDFFSSIEGFQPQ